MKRGEARGGERGGTDYTVAGAVGGIQRVEAKRRCVLVSHTLQHLAITQPLVF